MKRATIKRLIEEYEGDCPGDFLADVLDAERVASAALSRFRHAMQEAHKVFQAAKQSATFRWGQACDKCPHVEFTYCGDPAGGSSSVYVCDWCGKESKAPFPKPFKETSKQGGA